MNVSREAQAKVEAARALLERMTVPCAECITARMLVGNVRCLRCADTQHIPDPAYDGLRELVEDVCPMCRGTAQLWTGGSHPQLEPGYAPCPPYTVRDWTHSLSGSLRGAAEERLPLGWAMIPGMRVLHTPFGGFPEHSPDRDLAITTALEAALTAQLEAANALPR